MFLLSYLEFRISYLEEELKEKEKETEICIRSLRQEHERMKLRYERTFQFKDPNSLPLLQNSTIEASGDLPEVFKDTRISSSDSQQSSSDTGSASVDTPTDMSSGSGMMIYFSA